MQNKYTFDAKACGFGRKSEQVTIEPYVQRLHAALVNLLDNFCGVNSQSPSQTGYSKNLISSWLLEDKTSLLITIRGYNRVNHTA